MRGSSVALCLTGASAFAMGAPAWAQVQPDASSAGASEVSGAEPSVGTDIIVTARRRDEGIQDVPQVVNAVAGESIAKLNLRRFEDIQTVDGWWGYNEFIGEFDLHDPAGVWRESAAGFRGELI